jgi:hypothetical protein
MIPCHPVTRRKFDRSRRELGELCHTAVYRSISFMKILCEKEYIKRVARAYHSFVLAMYHYVAFEFAIMLGSLPLCVCETLQCGPLQVQ